MSERGFVASCSMEKKIKNVEYYVQSCDIHRGANNRDFCLLLLACNLQSGKPAYIAKNKSKPLIPGEVFHKNKEVDTLAESTNFNANVP